MFNLNISITTLKAINKNLAAFKTAGNLSGFIQTSDDEGYTVAFDGGDVLGKFDNPLDAMEAINNTGELLIQHNIINGSYKNYKNRIMKVNIENFLNILTKGK
ncbi:Uncharacterised protein [Klebsiella oxytoca]|uniref:hypothetical protein n=1 Tax=Klebsiella TaxID=570 RepID=UPI0007CBF446|nr:MULTISPECIES: hypothetical protein [Klebsiella]EIX9048235.1 DNA breaking-rejoining protein [Klebsiella oxytoca]MBG2577063.1 DNA breaking-rejoining protein [Klebsiella oxytoca]MBG2596776.1 DNA breaking-rejoining protein [Klebsiella oxytoca]MBZ7405057.1 DNA breaking-rejoining protein [Klebsiella grimontii]MCW9550768.1 DNA breaking-rejoining protein [Klebsiella oxytoca]